MSLKPKRAQTIGQALLKKAFKVEKEFRYPIGLGGDEEEKRLGYFIGCISAQTVVSAGNAALRWLGVWRNSDAARTYAGAETAKPSDLAGWTHAAP
jgi:hypothetical protein